MRLVFAVALLAAAVAARADDFPKLKAGLWETTTSSTRRDNTTPQMTTLCLDDSVQKEMYRMSPGMMSSMCSKHEIKTVGGKVTSEAVCDLGGTKMQSKSVMTFTGNSAYRTEAHATFDPPMMGTKESTTIIEGKHVGPCKPGQQPGDMTLPNGKTMNIRQLMAPKG
jgi:Protein of unknown function (DUF3617)